MTIPLMVAPLLDYAAMFASTFFVVLFLGLQSKNVMHSRYIAAMATSLGISVSQFVFTKYAAVGGTDTLAVCALGGMMGIATSIWLYDNVFKRGRRDCKNEVKENP